VSSEGIQLAKKTDDRRKK